MTGANPRGLSRRAVLIGGGVTILATACRGIVDGSETNEPPVWIAIPNQAWVVGVPVHFDLRDYVTDADALTFAVAGQLPAGLSLVGSVIIGTPTQATPLAAFTATADDGRG